LAEFVPGKFCLVIPGHQHVTSQIPPQFLYGIGIRRARGSLLLREKGVYETGRGAAMF
jgi:hypothetical protein